MQNDPGTCQKSDMMVDKFYKNNFRFYVIIKEDFSFINLLNFPKDKELNHDFYISIQFSS